MRFTRVILVFASQLDSAVQVHATTATSILAWFYLSVVTNQMCGGTLLYYFTISSIGGRQLHPLHPHAKCYSKNWRCSRQAGWLMCISPMIHSFTNHGVSFPISAPFAHLYTTALKDLSSLFTAYKLHMGISVKAAAL